MTKYNYLVVLLFSISALIFNTSCSRKANTYLYKSDGEKFSFPEKDLDIKSTAVCFSGGGTRAMTCAIGQMKAIDSLKLWSNIGYISSVSGGTWASSIFTYYKPTKKGPKNDRELLFSPLGASNLTMKHLKKEIPTTTMLHAPTRDLTKRILELLLEDDLTLGILERPEDIWIDAIGETYLKPFGLYCNKLKYFTLDNESLASIRERNSKWKFKKRNFVMVHNQTGDAIRPYLVMNSTVVSPSSLLPLQHPEPLTVFNYSPLGVGATKFQNITTKKGKEYTVGGGFLEPFAMGGSAPISPIKKGNDGQLSADIEMRKNHCFRLADAVGTSSAAFAASLAGSKWEELLAELIADGSLDPKQSYWAIQDEFEKAKRYSFADGGNLENFGLLTMLQRKVERVVVFINTDTQIDTTFIPGNVPPNSSTIDTDFYTLFGDSTYNFGDQTNNHVFSKEAFTEIFNTFKSCIHKGKTVLSKNTMVTKQNNWWGIPAGQEVEILWVHNYKVPAWEKQLPKETKNAIKKGKMFPNFPWYKTEFPDKFPFLVEYTPAMTKLLYELQFWNVYTNKEIQDFLKN